MSEPRSATCSRDSVDLDVGRRARPGRIAPTSRSAPRANVLFEGGGEARWSSGVGREQRLSAGTVPAARVVRQPRVRPRRSTARRGFRAQPTAAGWSIAPGLRVDRFSLVDRTRASPWVQAMVPLTETLTLRGGARRASAGAGLRDSARVARHARPARRARRITRTSASKAASDPRAAGR